MSAGVIIPQRAARCPTSGKISWQTCEPARATAWLAVPTKGPAVRFEKKISAREHLARAARLAAPQRRFSFGARLPSRLAAKKLLAQSSNPRKDS